MRCPFCRKRGNRVVDSRLSSDGAMIRRRRMCNACKKRFTTYERVEESARRVLGFKKKWAKTLRRTKAPSQATVASLSRRLWEFGEQVRIEAMIRAEKAQRPRK